MPEAESILKRLIFTTVTFKNSVLPLFFNRISFVYSKSNLSYLKEALYQNSFTLII